MKKIKGILTSILLTLVLICYPSMTANAWVANGYVLSNPSNITYTLSATVGPYSADTITYMNKWATYCNEIGGFTAVNSNENIYFYGDYTVSNGTLGVTTHYDNDSAVITFYNAFITTTAAERYDVIIHEVGHVLGLSHTQKANFNISVMRNDGECNEAGRPLSDDISGIAAIY